MVKYESTPYRGGIDEDQYWYKRAACKNAIKELFSGNTAEDVAMAKKICKDCEVAVQCLTEALLMDSVGVWGGTTERERAKLKKRFRRGPEQRPNSENN